MKTIGVIAVIAGWLTLTLWGVKIGIMEGESLFLKVGVGGLWLGFLMLLVIALVGRDKESKSDPSNDVEL